MNGRTLAIALSALSLLLAAGCSTEGPTVIDPRSLQRTQSALVAIDKGSAGELVRFSEQNGLVSSTEYASANGGDTVPPIDAIYDQNDRLYLHHRKAGVITVLDLNTRKKVSEIAGFPAMADSASLCGMAFSNLSQAWVVCYNSHNLYQVDAVNRVIADTIPPPGNPTSVGTTGTLVLVGMQMPDGSGGVAVLHSNSGTLAIEKTLPYPSPIIYISASNDGAQAFLLSSGGPGDAKPHLYYLYTGNQASAGETEIDSPPMTDYIGREPNYASTSRLDFLYAALPQTVVQIDTHNQTVAEWNPGKFSMVAADYTTDLVYISDGSVMKRKTIDNEELEDVTLPGSVRAIHFVSTSKLH